MQKVGVETQRTTFLHLGDMVEEERTSEILTITKDKRTGDYSAGGIG